MFKNISIIGDGAMGTVLAFELAKAGNLMYLKDRPKTPINRVSQKTMP